MPVTAITAFGRLAIHYQQFKTSHVLRVYVAEFLTDPEVGTFSAPSTPASLDALATDLANVLKPLYPATSELAFGSWVGEQHVPGTDDSFVPIVNGEVTGVTAAFGSVPNDAGAVSQMTWTFRTATFKLMRLVALGNSYPGSVRYFYGGISAQYQALADYVTGSAVLRSRGNAAISGMVSLTFDTNDGLTRKYRR